MSFSGGNQQFFPFAPGTGVPTSAGSISSITGTNPVQVTQGNNPVISITNPLPVIDGGTGTSTPNLLAGSNVTVSGTWPNQTISATVGGAGVAGVSAEGPLSSTGGSNPIISITNPLPVVNGGTGSSGPSLVAGANITIGGSWPNQSINSAGAVATVSALTPLSSSGGANPVISLITPLAVNYGGTGTTGGAVTKVTASGNITSSGGLTPNIAISNTPSFNGAVTASNYIATANGVALSNPAYPNSGYYLDNVGNVAIRAPGSLFLQGDGGFGNLNITQVGSITAFGNISAPAFLGNATTATTATNQSGGTVNCSSLTASSANVNGALSAYTFGAGASTFSSTVGVTGTLSLGAGGNVILSAVTSGGGVFEVRVNANGTIFQNSSGSANTAITCSALTQTSDASIKDNIRPLEHGLDTLKKVQARRWDWVEENYPAPPLGFVAQEMQSVIPEMVSEPDPNGNLGLSYSTLIPVLVNAIQELSAKVERLEARG